jgi:hypothetical protein
VKLATPSVRWTEWAEVIIGVLVFLAPRALGFSALANIVISAWIAGILALQVRCCSASTGRPGWPSND